MCERGFWVFLSQLHMGVVSNMTSLSREALLILISHWAFPPSRGTAPIVSYWIKSLEGRMCDSAHTQSISPHSLDETLKENNQEDFSQYKCNYSEWGDLNGAKFSDLSIWTPTSPPTNTQASTVLSHTKMHLPSQWLSCTAVSFVSGRWQSEACCNQWGPGPVRLVCHFLTKKKSSSLIK